jgi:hypothetical protein
LGNAGGVRKRVAGASSAHVGDVVVTAAFKESQGRTLTLHRLFPSKEALEGALAWSAVRE